MKRVDLSKKIKTFVAFRLNSVREIEIFNLFYRMVITSVMALSEFTATLPFFSVLRWLYRQNDPGRQYEH